MRWSKNRNLLEDPLINVSKLESVLPIVSMVVPFWGYFLGSLI